MVMIRTGRAALVCLLGLLAVQAPVFARPQDATPTTDATSATNTVSPTVVSPTNTVLPTSPNTSFGEPPEGTAVTTNTAVPTDTNTANFPATTGVPLCALESFANSVQFVNCADILQTSCYCLDPAARQAFVTHLVLLNSVDCPDQLQASQNLASAYCKLANVALTFPPPTTTRPTVGFGSTGTSGGNGGAQTTSKSAAGAGLDNTWTSFGWAAGAAAVFVGIL